MFIRSVQSLQTFLITLFPIADLQNQGGKGIHQMLGKILWPIKAVIKYVKTGSSINRGACWWWDMFLLHKVTLGLPRGLSCVLTPRKCQGFGPLSNPHYQNALYLFQWSASAAKLWSSKICQIVQNYLEELVLEKTLRNFRGTQQNDKILEMFIGLI